MKCNIWLLIVGITLAVTGYTGAYSTFYPSIDALWSYDTYAWRLVLFAAGVFAIHCSLRSAAPAAHQEMQG
ncbi:hypothetical protein [Streptomyces sp. NBC_01304]|uniref:hypothetical protein n=1 Tax=Streptomyces sp. NBC_01304 TaxID=2903818 RepID=UPI002E10E18C|nr:hypothetical protein OG430_42420 [Streptomyces sp. NBC_01304]